MKTISVTELKTHLSREIRKVEKGNNILITDHDHPVAMLTSVRKNGNDWSQIADKPMKTFKLRHSVTVNTYPLEILQEERKR
jgi:prevent-host-death family protein